MSYITQDFQSKSDLIVGGDEWQKVVLNMKSQFAEAGVTYLNIGPIGSPDEQMRIVEKLKEIVS